MKKIDKPDRMKLLEEYVRVLETFAVRLEEKLKFLEQENKGIKATDYSSLDHLHPLIRTNSLKVKCDECDLVFRRRKK